MAELLKTQDIIETLRSKIQSYNDKQTKLKDLRNVLVITKQEMVEYKTKYNEKIKNTNIEIETMKKLIDESKKDIENIKAEMRKI